MWSWHPQALRVSVTVARSARQRWRPSASEMPFLGSRGEPQNGLPSFWGAPYAHQACRLYTYGRLRAARTCVHADYPPRTCLGDA